jgi:S1-C subfamily serine protease
VDAGSRPRDVHQTSARRARHANCAEANARGAERGLLAGPGMKQLIAVLVLSISIVAGTRDAGADSRRLKSNVVIVRPQFHDKTRVAFHELAGKLAALAAETERADASKKDVADVLRGVAMYYEQLAVSPGHGTGWFWIPPGGDVAFVVTNKHVAGQAASVRLEFDNNRHPRIDTGRVIYSDPIHDISVIEVAKRDLPAETTGFEVVEADTSEGVAVWASGFPGTETRDGQIPAYSLTNGIVSNADFPGPEGKVIAHTATIDPGNSGGPLLVEASRAALRYHVIGMNTWKHTGRGRTNVNLSINAPTIAQALRDAQQARLVAGDRDRLARSLRLTAERLADELGSARPDFRLLNGMISYSFVAERPEIIQILLEQLLAGKLTPEQGQRFLEEPLEASRERLWLLFFATFSTGASNLGDVRLDRITDEDRVTTDRAVRTVYQIAGKKQEIVWAWEHGAWRIADASFEHAFAAAPPPASSGGSTAGAGTPADPAKRTAVVTPEPTGADTATKVVVAPGQARRLSLAVRIAMGYQAATNGDFSSTISDQDSGAYSAELAFAVNKHFAIATGLGYHSLGAEYQISDGGDFYDVWEDVWYVQVPVLARAQLALAGKVGEVRLFASGGLALDLAMDRGGGFSGGGTGGDLPAEWYDEHNELNVAALLGGGLEFGFGRAPALYLGVDVRTERHLLDEWTDAQFSGGENYRYTATRFGLSLRYQPRR